MPIKPENRDRYPADWPEIRKSILERAGHHCEVCGVQNHVWRDNDDGRVTCDGYEAVNWRCDGCSVTRIVLTIAHLDHVPEHCDHANLMALCQRCHLDYDREHHIAQASRTRAERAAAGTPALPGLAKEVER